MNDIAPMGTKPDQLYAKMQNAIGRCYSIDDCAVIATQADGIAAYFKQVRDDESVKKFLAVKVRAWRKIGEILLTVDDSGCETQSAHVRKIKQHFKDDPSVSIMSDSAIVNAVKLGRLPEDFFEKAVGENPRIHAILCTYQDVMREEWESTPEGKQELLRRAEAAKQTAELTAQRTAAQRIEAAEEAKKVAEAKAEMQAKLDQQYLDHQAMEAARDEVGYTMDRRDRERMREVLFLIKDSVHATLRQAAFDRHMTMQAILRAGLAMWFISNGYPVDMDDFGMGPKTKKAA